MNFKNLMACMVAVLFSVAAFAQTVTCQIAGSANFSNLNPCGGAISVNGLAKLQYRTSDPPAWSDCNGSQVLVQVQYYNGTTWNTVASTTVSIVTGAYSIPFTPTATGYYRIYETVSSYGNCSCSPLPYVSVSSWITINTPVTAAFNINGSAASTTSPYAVYGPNCPKLDLLLNNTSTGTTTFSPQWRLTFQECNASGVVTGTLHGQPAWQSGWPAASYDLKTWNPSGSFTLGSAAAISKYYLITLELKNGCSGTASVKQGIVFINAPLALPAGTYGVRDNTSGTACSIGNTSSNPCPVCTGAAVFAFNGGTGLVIGYTKTVERWNGSAWVIDFGPTDYAYFGTFPSSPSGVTLPITGSSFTWVMGAQYRMTIVFKGACGDLPITQYFYTVSCKTDEVTSIDDLNPEELNIELYPNPSNNIVTLNISTEKAGQYSAKLYNINGQEVLNISENIELPLGENYTQFSVNDLPKGSYILRVNTPEQKTVNLKLIKD